MFTDFASSGQSGATFLNLHYAAKVTQKGSVPRHRSPNAGLKCNESLAAFRRHNAAELYVALKREFRVCMIQLRMHCPTTA